MANQKIIKQWFIYAVRDLKAAKGLFKIGAEQTNAVGFHSQQCVEKAIKGYLLYLNIKPSRTHSIKELAHQLKDVDLKTFKILMSADRLTKYAVIYRYPDAELKPTAHASVKSAVKIAERIYLRLYELVYP